MAEARTAEQAPTLIVGSPVPDAHDDHPTVSALRRRFGDAIHDVQADAVGVPVVTLDPKLVHEILSYLKQERDQAYDLLVDVMGVDQGGGGPIQVWYQLWSMRHGRSVRLVCALPRSGLKVRSAVSIWRAADWLEREVYDMFGIRFDGHPDLRRILMPDDYTDFPLRKEFPLYRG